MARARVVVCIVLLLCVACERQTPEPVGLAPEPSPSGALYGRVVRPDGRAVPGAHVTLWQFEDADIVRGVTAALSLGFFCLLPTDAFCPSSVGTDADDNGAYSVEPEDMKDDPSMNITATSGGAETSVTLKDGPDPQRIPDLVLWAPRVRVEGRGAKAAVTWSKPDANIPHGKKVTYEAHVFASDRFASRPIAQIAPTSKPRGSIDMRIIEDAKAFVVVSAVTEVDGDRFTYRAAKVDLPAGRPAISRGRPCLADDKTGRMVRAKEPCILTDGNLEFHDEVLLKGECVSTGENPCVPPVTHKRLCVDLEGSRTVSLVVVRAPFLDGVRASLSNDGRTFTNLSPPFKYPTSEDRPALFSAKVDPPRPARMVCVDRLGAAGFAPHKVISGSILAEVSVW